MPKIRMKQCAGNQEQMSIFYNKAKDLEEPSKELISFIK